VLPYILTPHSPLTHTRPANRVPIEGPTCVCAITQWDLRASMRPCNYSKLFASGVTFSEAHHFYHVIQMFRGTRIHIPFRFGSSSGFHGSDFPAIFLVGFSSLFFPCGMCCLETLGESTGTLKPFKRMIHDV